jgi:hypothetical protein
MSNHHLIRQSPYYRPAVENLTHAAASRMLRLLADAEVQAQMIQELLLTAAGPDTEEGEALAERVKASQRLIQLLLEGRAAAIRAGNDPRGRGAVVTLA